MIKPSKMSDNSFRKLIPVKEVLPSNADNFIVCAMFTGNYGNKAKKLEASLVKFRMPHALFEISSIHSSISPHGSTNSPYNKPQFVKAMLEKYKLSILYLDIDCVIESKPSLINELVEQDYDLAIFNWLSKERNDSYQPFNFQGIEPNRFFGYTHGVNFYDESQLRCSGAVQFWANTRPALDLLNVWNRTIEENPHAPDDRSLDFAFNNKFEKGVIRSYWLPKSYARYAFWIFDKPIINHPDFPNSNLTKFQEIKFKEGEHLLNEGSLKKKPILFFIQPNTFLDIKKNRVVSIQGEILLKISENTRSIYID
jgi:hypothetical protein